MENTVTINVERYDELRKYEEAYNGYSPIVFSWQYGCGFERRMIAYNTEDVIEELKSTIKSKDETLDKAHKSLSELWIDFNKLQVERDNLLKATQPKNKKWWQKLFS